MGLQSLKDVLVRLGPDSALVQAALSMNARVHGFRVSFTKQGLITIAKSDRVIVLDKSQYVQVPFMMEYFELYFDTFVEQESDGSRVLNFSAPGFHRYRKHDIGFYFPSIPEEDSMDAYTHWYRPKPGDTVWDAGAHAGASVCFLSRLVGDTGKVVAFEPDDLCYGFLEKNIELHGLKNVVTVRKALSDKRGWARFVMDGTLAAGISDFVKYSDEKRIVAVPTLSIEDACNELSAVPDYVKMDIEGAELAAIRGSLDFLRSHTIEFVIESNHWVNGKLTWKPLEDMFGSIAYEVKSSGEFLQMFTWARPRRN